MTEPVAAGATAPRNGRRNILIGVGTLVGLAVLLALYWLLFLRGWVSTDDARFAADMVDVAPQVGGTLAEVLVAEGDSVRTGQTLYRLDAASLEAAAKRALAGAQSAHAELEVARANLEKSEHGPRPDEIQAAEATEARTKAQADLAHVDWERAQKVFDQGALPAADRDRAKTAWETAVHVHEEAAAQLRLLKEGTRAEDRAAARQNVALAQAKVEAAEAAARQAEIDRDHATVQAPFDGLVVKKWLDAGATVAVGQPVLTLMNPASLHVSADVEEKDLHRIAPGDPVRIRVDAYPALELTGRVGTIIRATDSEFSLIPAEGVSGTFIKVTQRVPLSVKLDRMPAEPIGPGLSVEIRIDTRGHRSSGPSLADRP